MSQKRKKQNAETTKNGKKRERAQISKNAGTTKNGEMQKFRENANKLTKINFHAQKWPKLHLIRIFCTRTVAQ